MVIDWFLMKEAKKIYDYQISEDENTFHSSQ